MSTGGDSSDSAKEDGSSKQVDDQTTDAKVYSVLKLTSTKVVSEKMVLNLLQKTKYATPISTRIISISTLDKTGSCGTVVFLLYENENEAAETNENLVNQAFQKKRFEKRQFKATEAEIPKTGSDLNLPGENDDDGSQGNGSNDSSSEEVQKKTSPRKMVKYARKLKQEVFTRIEVEEIFQS